MSTWQFDITEDWDTIYNEDYEKQWEEIMNNSPHAHVFFTPTLVKVWLDTYRPLRKLHPLFFLGINNRGVRVFMPLVLWQRNWKHAFMRTIVPVGYSDYDYHDPIFSEEVAAEEVADFWETLVDTLKSCCKFDEIQIDGLHKEFTPPPLVN